MSEFRLGLLWGQGVLYNPAEKNLLQVEMPTVSKRVNLSQR